MVLDRVLTPLRTPGPRRGWPRRRASRRTWSSTARTRSEVSSSSATFRVGPYLGVGLTSLDSACCRTGKPKLPAFGLPVDLPAGKKDSTAKTAMKKGKAGGKAALEVAQLSTASIGRLVRRFIHICSQLHAFS